MTGIILLLSLLLIVFAIIRLFITNIKIKRALLQIDVFLLIPSIIVLYLLSGETFYYCLAAVWCITLYFQIKNLQFINQNHGRDI